MDLFKSFHFILDISVYCFWNFSVYKTHILYHFYFFILQLKMQISKFKTVKNPFKIAICCIRNFAKTFLFLFPAKRCLIESSQLATDFGHLAGCPVLALSMVITSVFFSFNLTSLLKTKQVEDK